MITLTKAEEKIETLFSIYDVSKEYLDTLYSKIIYSEDFLSLRVAYLPAISLIKSYNPLNDSNKFLFNEFKMLSDIIYSYLNSHKNIYDELLENCEYDPSKYDFAFLSYPIENRLSSQEVAKTFSKGNFCNKYKLKKIMYDYASLMLIPNTPN